MVLREKIRKISAAEQVRRRVADKRPTPAPILDPIITMNASGLIQSASDSVEQMFGWTPGELYGQNVTVLIPEPKQSNMDRYLDRYRKSSNAKSLSKSRVFDAVCKDGTLIKIELSISRADLPANAPAYFIGIIRNVSEEIQVNSENGQEQTRMHRLVTEQTRALATANLRLHLADRLTALGTLAAGLGHDMNNVLLPVRSRLNAMEHAGISTVAMGHLTAIRSSIAYLQHLSDGLHFLTIDPGSTGDTPEGEMTTNVSHWWRDMGTLLSKAVPKHVKVIATLPTTLPEVHIAPYLLTQAMLNLLVNAGESIPTGNRNGKVRVWAKRTIGGTSLRIGVSDNGRGMSPSIQRRAFDLFFTTKTRAMGTGLGLPLARKLAVRAGGDIELQSVPGKGTSAVLVLPIVKGSDVKAAKRDTRRISAAVSVRDHRIASIISHVFIAAGVELKAVKDTNPGTPDMWVTQPTAKALASVQRLRRNHRNIAVVLVGMPHKNAQKNWDKIGAAVIDRVDDFEAIRQTLGQTMSAQTKHIDKERRL